MFFSPNTTIIFLWGNFATSIKVVQWCCQKGFDGFDRTLHFLVKGSRTRQFLVLQSQMHNKNSDLSVLLDYQVNFLLEMQWCCQNRFDGFSHRSYQRGPLRKNIRVISIFHCYFHSCHFMEILNFMNSKWKLSSFHLEFIKFKNSAKWHEWK